MHANFHFLSFGIHYKIKFLRFFFKIKSVLSDNFQFPIHSYQDETDTYQQEKQ